MNKLIALPFVFLVGCTTLPSFNQNTDLCTLAQKGAEKGSLFASDFNTPYDATRYLNGELRDLANRKNLTPEQWQYFGQGFKFGFEHVRTRNYFAVGEEALSRCQATK